MILAGFIIEAGFLALALLGDLRGHLPPLFAIYTIQFMIMLWAWSSERALSVPMIWIFAILFRLTLLPTMPSLSDDIYRYGWEGRVQRAGWSPYEYPPSAPELSFLRDESYPRVNHNDVPTLYPPLAQIVFRAGSYLADGLRAGGMAVVRAAVLSQKSLFLLFDLLCMWVIGELLRRRGRPYRQLVLYAWNPLVVLEFAGSGHNDSLGIFYLVLGLLCWEQGRSVWATFGLAASFLSKYISVLLVPFFVWKKRWKELGLWVLFVAAGLVPFCFCWMMVHGAGHYAARWQFNASLFAVLDWISPQPQWAKWAVAALAGLCAVVLGKTQDDLIRVSYLLISASLLLAPTLHPWYLAWLIPFLCLYPNVAFLGWNLTIVLSYTVWPRYWQTHVWDLHRGVQFLEYAPVYALLIYGPHKSSTRYYFRKVVPGTTFVGETVEKLRREPSGD